MIILLYCDAKLLLFLHTFLIFATVAMNLVASVGCLAVVFVLTKTVVWFCLSLKHCCSLKVEHCLKQ